MIYNVDHSAQTPHIYTLKNLQRYNCLFYPIFLVMRISSYCGYSDAPLHFNTHTSTLSSNIPSPIDHLGRISHSLAYFILPRPQVSVGCPFGASVTLSNMERCVNRFIRIEYEAGTSLRNFNEQMLAITVDLYLPRDRNNGGV
jgi:hypothetical protein